MGFYWVRDSSSSSSAFDLPSEKVDLFLRSDLVDRDLWENSFTAKWDSSGSDIGYRVTIAFETEWINDSDFVDPISEYAGAGWWIELFSAYKNFYTNLKFVI